MEITRSALLSFLLTLFVVLALGFWAFIPIIEYYTTYPFITVNFNEPVTVVGINNMLKEKYPNETYPQGKAIIISELDKVNKINDTKSKLNEIFTWEMNDWHNPLWEKDKFFGYSGDSTFLFYDRNLSRFKVNSLAESRLFLQKNPDGILFSNDPYTIAYTKIGSCKELSNLFSYMAQQSGIESRTVSTLADHQWVEVKINGEWMYYDPWCAVEHGYYDSKNKNFTYEDKWFNKIEYFSDNCHGLAFINWYNDYPYILATPVYDSSYIWKDIKNYFPQ
jgi:hypothetical protein